MPERYDRQKLLLSIASPLYAPLYLAKVASLDPIFQQLDFEYRSSRGKLSQGDPLVRDVLSLTTDLDCLAAVCDPFRALIKDASGKGMMDRPLIVGCLIRHMCYWLIDGHIPYGDYNETEIADVFDRIIVAQRHTTNYAVAADHLLKRCNVPDIKIADSILYSYAPSGYEQRYYRRFHNAFKLAYMTMNPLSLYSVGAEEAIKKPFLLDERYRDTFMTGVVVGLDAYAKKTAEIDGLMQGIVKAIELIYRDPLLAARLLQSYRDDYISFNVEDIRFDHLVASLEYLVSHGAFAQDARMPISAMARGAEVRASARCVNPDAPHLMDLSEIANCVRKDIVESEPVGGPRDHAVKHEPWIERFVIATLRQDYARGEKGAGLSFELLASSVLLAASLCLLFAGQGAYLGTLDAALGRGHFDLPHLTLDAAGSLAGLSVLCALPEWLRFLFGKKRLHILRTVIMNLTTITAVIIMAGVFFNRDAAFGAFLSLALPAGYSWSKYHLPDFRRFGESVRRFWRNLRMDYSVWTAARPVRRAGSQSAT